MHEKISKIVMTFILTSALYTCVLPTSIVHATEFPVAFRASNPYPEHSWINLGTITLDPVTINNAIAVSYTHLDVYKRQGYDCVEFHCGHNYLPHSFLSPAFNHREDAYGGTFEKRCKFPLD